MTSPAPELDLIDDDDWVTPDDIAREVEIMNDPGYCAAMGQYLRPIFKRAEVGFAAWKKDFSTLARLTANDPGLKRLAFDELTKHARVTRAAQRLDFSALVQLTADDHELTRWAFSELAREHARERAPGGALAVVANTRSVANASAAAEHEPAQQPPASEWPQTIAPAALEVADSRTVYNRPIIKPADARFFHEYVQKHGKAPTWPARQRALEAAGVQPAPDPRTLQRTLPKTPPKSPD